MKLVGLRDLWKVKIFIFHCIMVTKYILFCIGGWFSAELSMLLMVLLIPFGDWFVSAIVYWIAILTETIEMMVQTWKKLHYSYKYKALSVNKFHADATQDKIMLTQ